MIQNHSAPGNGPHRDWSQAQTFSSDPVRDERAKFNCSVHIMKPDEGMSMPAFHLVSLLHLDGHTDPAA